MKKEFYQDGIFYLFLLTCIIGLFSFWIYQKDIFKGKTRPHPLSWLLWLITLSIATYGVIVGHGGYGAYYHIIYLLFITIILLKTLKKGGFEKADQVDWFLFIGALLLVPITVLVSEEVGVFLASIVDLIGFVSTWRKAYDDPTGEPIWAWILAIPTLILLTIIMGQYSFLTWYYDIFTIIADLVLVVICLYRRRVLISKENC